MKVQVTKKAKGELFIRAINKTIRSGSKVMLTLEQFEDSATQAAIQAGYLEAVDGAEAIRATGSKYINNYKNSLSFKCIKRSIPSGGTFFVSDDLFGAEIDNALDLGYIEEVKDEESTIEVVDVEELKDFEIVETEKPKTKRVSKKKPSTKRVSKKKTAKKKSSTKRISKKKSSKKIKKIGRSDGDALSEEISVSVGSSPEESDMGSLQKTHSIPKGTSTDVPDGMYAHDPTGEGSTVRKGSAPKAVKSSDSIFIDGTDKSEDLSFVDNEQTKERAAKNGIIINDVFDNNIEVE